MKNAKRNSIDFRGFAAALPDGNLIVPNIKNAQGICRLWKLLQQVSEIGTRAKNGKLKPRSTSEILLSRFLIQECSVQKRNADYFSATSRSSPLWERF